VSIGMIIVFGAFLIHLGIEEKQKDSQIETLLEGPPSIIGNVTNIQYLTGFSEGKNGGMILEINNNMNIRMEEINTKIIEGHTYKFWIYKDEVVKYSEVKDK